ncbi:MAG: DUF6142 family protein [Roseburia sp.]|nr:DUF6142 family protein [Roseburia sp.]MCM1279769.1 DUF6142 family protein [Robinsoniella sp.]
MRKPSYMFTNKSHPRRGIIATLLGGIDMAALCLAIWLCFQNRGVSNARLGTATLFALLFSLVGLVLGILSRLEKDKFYIFPTIGITLNFLVIAFVAFILFAGAYNV